MGSQREKFFGQGPKMIRPAMLAAALGGAAAWAWPSVFLFPAGFLQPLRALIGWMLVLAALGLYFWGMVRLLRAMKEDRLDTDGPFALVRHPMYSAWLVFLFPGLALVTGAWAIVAASVAGWFAFRRWAPVEERSMLDRFGSAYERYREQVPALIPIPR
ncbi:isoprenylcysteine carboxylmethyltransferase family protein [Pseudodesulfovibrio indicus]|uniref:methyltransferase family protein n=1 Tax=Pseudodesulfovibrio indicus TaxID=1716143 RepID=UPI00292E111E|nr:isoprenylcysteine carboxylmethyltransferase family protein [Pseudodesulfovibrio indicus]